MKDAQLSYDIVISGRGGQGVLFLSRMIGEAALFQGLMVRTTETHGMAMRGGSVLCFVRIGECMAPLFQSGAGRLQMALHDGEVAGGMRFLGPGSRVLVNTREQIKPDLMRLDADGIAASAGNSRSANLALLGAAVTLEDFPLEAQAVESVIKRTGSGRITEINLEIFRSGLTEAEREK